MIMCGRALADDQSDASSVWALAAWDVRVRCTAFGSQVDSFEIDGEIDGGPARAVFTRAPQVEKIGSDVAVLASLRGTDAVPVESPAGTIVAVRQVTVLATVFRPELVGEDERVHRYPCGPSVRPRARLAVVPS